MVWPLRDSNPRSTTIETSALTIAPPQRFRSVRRIVYHKHCFLSSMIIFKFPFDRYTPYRWIDWLILASRPAGSISAVFRTRTGSIIFIYINYIEMRKGSVWTGWITFDCHRKSMDIWKGTTHLVLCTGYNVPCLLVFKIYKRGLYRAGSVARYSL